MYSLKPSIEVYIFGRATLSSLAMSFAMFTTKEDLNTKKKVFFLPIILIWLKTKKLSCFLKKQSVYKLC